MSTPTLSLDDLHGIPIESEAPGLWPPAPGWWLLAGVVIIALILLIGLRQLKKREAWRKQALLELEIIRAMDAEFHINALSSLLRRVAISRFPRSGVAALTGDQWLMFLDSKVQNCNFYTQGNDLTTTAYRRHADTNSDQLFLLGERWIRGLK